jgi:Gas vesicle synthesis protein GvpO
MAQRVRRGLTEITGMEAERVTAVEQFADGKWKATVELLEFSRIPETDDVLGTYEALVDASGELLGYQRVRRYARSRPLQERVIP